MIGLLIPTAGVPRLVDITPGHEAIARAIGATWIERVRTPVRGMVLIVDEEGLLDDREWNPTVTGVLFPGMIAGDVIAFSEEVGPDGPDLADLTPDHQTALRTLGYRFQPMKGTQ